MYKYIKLVIMLLLIGIISLNSQAQLKNKKSIFILKGQIEVPDSITSIKIEYYKDYSENWDGLNCKIFDVPLKKGKFKLETTQITEIGYIKMIVDGQRNGFVSPLSLPFLTEPYDQIALKYTKGHLSFSGNGAEKYNLIYQFNLVRPKAVVAVPQEEDSLVPWNMQRLDSLYLVKLALLKGKRVYLNNRIYAIINLNLKSENLYAKTEFFLRNYGFQRQPDVLKALAEFNKYVKSDLIKRPNDIIALKSYNYVDFLFLKEEFENEFTFNGRHKLSQNFLKITNNIISEYSGLVRDKMLACWIIGSYGHLPVGVDADSVVFAREIALRVANRKSLFYDIILNRKKRFEKGADVYPFALKDSSGNIHTLAMLKNKIAIVDFYFNGCSGCARLSRAMTPVTEKFKENPDVIFVSISVDKTRQLFTDAVKKGIYTHPESINLWTGEVAEEHNIMKFYGFIGCPQLLIIDKNGKILFENPIRPSLNRKTGEIDPADPGVIQMIKIIEDGLANKK